MHSSQYSDNLAFEILIQPGEHWIKRKDLIEYQELQKAYSDVQLEHSTTEIIIRTDVSVCEKLTLEPDKTNCLAFGKAKINNKVGSLFELTVPKTLTVSNIIFDSLQSI